MHYEMGKVLVTDLKLFGPTGDFGRWMQRIDFELGEEAARQAPSGATSGRINKTSGYPVGSLIASVDCDHDRMSPRLYELVLSANVPYAAYVHEGTRDIYKQSSSGGFAAAAPGEGMYIPGNPGWGPARWRQKVRGQSANPFLTRAMSNVGRGHSAIKVWAG